jgi:glucose/arabinose dehydrogenase/PKD repeat protein
MPRALLALLFAALILAPAARADAGLPAGFSEATVWSHLDDPTGLRFAPNGHVFVTGKSGLVYEFDSLDDPTPSIYADLRTEVHAGWDRGLLGLAVDANGRVFVAYTYDKAPDGDLVPAWNDDCPDLIAGCAVQARLSRLDRDGTEHVLLTDFCDQFTSHSIGTLQLGPDGMLYMGGGDGADYSHPDYGENGGNPCGGGAPETPPTARGGSLRAQGFAGPDASLSSLDGSIVRLDPNTGRAASGNPAAASPDALRQRIYAYGFRNPFRFTFRPGTDELWAGDVGQAAWEEIDRVPRPASGAVPNYGWPCFEGAVHQDGFEALNLDACTTLYGRAGSTVMPYYVYRHGQPVVAGDGCGTDSSALSGIAFEQGSDFPPGYKDALFFTDYARQCIWVMPAGADGLPDPSQLRRFASGPFAVDLEFGPDGALYYPDIVDGGIHRIAYAAPTATIGAADEGRTFHFSGSGGISYAWDLDGDGSYDDSTSPAPSFTYDHDGPVTVRLRVTDAGGATDTAAKTIQVGTPPQVRIDTPAADTTWAVGDTIPFAGTGPSLKWSLEVHACAQTCGADSVEPLDGDRFVAPDHAYPSYLELVATAAGANGLTSSSSVRLNPKTADITMQSSPPGLKLSFAGESAATPFTRTVIACSATTVTAPSPQSLGATTSVLDGWDDGAAQTRTVRAPYEGGATYAASFAPAQDRLLAGTDVVGSDVSTAYPGGGEAYRTTAATSGDVLALRLRVAPASDASQLTMGLYSEADGDASALLATGTLDAPRADSWNEVRLSAPVHVEAGRRYWIAVLDPASSTGELDWYDRAGTGGGLERTSQSKALTDLPPVWWTNVLYTDGGPLSASAVGPPAAPPIGGSADAPPCAKPAPTSPQTPGAAPTPTPEPAAAPLPTLPRTSAPLKAKLPKLTVPSKLERKGSHVTVPLTCPKVASCRFTVKLGAHAKTATAKAGRRVSLSLPAPRSRRARLTITRRTDGQTATAKRYALISAPSSRATRAA